MVDVQLTDPPLRLRKTAPCGLQSRLEATSDLLGLRVRAILSDLHASPLEGFPGETGAMARLTSNGLGLKHGCGCDRGTLA